MLAPGVQVLKQLEPKWSKYPVFENFAEESPGLQMEEYSHEKCDPCTQARSHYPDLQQARKEGRMLQIWILFAGEVAPSSTLEDLD